MATGPGMRGKRDDKETIGYSPNIEKKGGRPITVDK